MLICLLKNTKAILLAVFELSQVSGALGFLKLNEHTEAMVVTRLGLTEVAEGEGLHVASAVHITVEELAHVHELIFLVEEEAADTGNLPLVPFSLVALPSSLERCLAEAVRQLVSLIAEVDVA